MEVEPTSPDAKPDLREVEITADESGMRLDKALSNRVPDLSRQRIQDLIASGAVRLRSTTIGSGSPLSAKQKVRVGDLFEITVPEVVESTIGPEPIPLDIMYEDESLIVINKPAGLVVHPSPGHGRGTLVNALLHHCGDSLSGIGGVRRPGIVHRIDKDTSGLIVVAKTDAAHEALATQFADHSIERKYVALVWGRPTPLVHKVDKPIGRHPTHRLQMAVVDDEKGRNAVTHYHVKQSWRWSANTMVSLIDCRLETGRTHQIRVHMSDAGHPLVGDQLYGGRRPQIMANGEPFQRQALHAAELGFVHPETGAALKFECSPPFDFDALLSTISSRAVSERP
ncbi:MAG: RluA family pseudouridine synthase [Pseudomonadota bacterium]